MPSPVEIVRLRQAMDAFRDRAPRDLPKGVMEGLDVIEKQLSAYAPRDDISPGQKQALEAQGTDGTGEHFSRAAKGPDGPSPGQREARRLSEEMQKASAGAIENLSGKQ